MGFCLFLSFCFLFSSLLDVALMVFIWHSLTFSFYDILHALFSLFHGTVSSGVYIINATLKVSSVGTDSMLYGTRLLHFCTALIPPSFDIMT